MSAPALTGIPALIAIEFSDVPLLPRPAGAESSTASTALGSVQLQCHGIVRILSAFHTQIKENEKNRKNRARVHAARLQPVSQRANRGRCEQVCGAAEGPFLSRVSTTERLLMSRSLYLEPPEAWKHSGWGWGGRRERERERERQSERERRSIRKHA